MRLAQNRLLDVAAVLLVVASVARLVTALPARARENDFAHYYVTSRLVWEGQNPFVTSLEPAYRALGLVFEPEVARATNPPTVQWLFLPLALLPVKVAFWIWVGAQAACLAVILALTRHLLAKHLSTRALFFVCAAAVASAAVYWHFIYGQFQLLLAALLLVAFVCHRQGRHTAACVIATCAALLKLYPLALVPWFVWRSANRTRAALASLFVAVTIVLVTQPVRWLDFFRHGIPSLAEDALNRTFNYNVPAFIANLAQSSYNFEMPADAARAWWFIATVAGLILLGCAYAICWRRGGDQTLEFALLNVAMVAASAKASGHYLVFAIFPMAVAAVNAGNARRWIWLSIIYVLLNVFATWDTPFLSRHLMLKVLANHLPLYGLLGLGWVLTVELRAK